MKNYSIVLCIGLFLMCGITVRAQSKYSLQWNRNETYKVSGGVVYRDYWEVRNDSAIFSTGNIVINEPGKLQYKASIQLGHEGTLNDKDQAIVYFILNERIAKSFVIRGDEAEEKRNSDFTFITNKSSAIKINIVFKSLGTDRSWKLVGNSVKVELLARLNDPEISVVMHENSSKISWKQKTTANSNYFVVEQSNNGQDFSPCGLVVATRSGNMDLFSLICKKASSETLFYRIKLKDFSGDEIQVGEVYKVGGEINLSSKLE